MLRFRIHNHADVRKGIIWLHDIIGVEDNTSAEVARVLNQMESNGVSKFEVHINSPGGLVFDGLAIYNMLRERDTDIIIDGIAASIASVIACAGQNVKMYKNTFFMIHNPWTFAAGDAEYMRKLSDQLDQIRESITQAYADRTGLNAETLTDMMDEESYINAEDSLELGFCTEIIDKKSSVDTEKIKNQFLNLIKGDDPMREFLIQLLALAATATDTDIQNALKALKSNADQVDDLVAQVAELQSKIESGGDSGSGSGGTEIDALKASIESLTTVVNDLSKENRRIKAQAAVDQAISEGKIFPAQREDYMATAEADPQAFLARVEKMPVLFDPQNKIDFGDGDDDDAPMSKTEKFKAAMRKKQAVA